MSSFGKLTDYFIRRKSHEDLRGARRESQRSSSYCCTVAETRSLEKKLQRPLLAKSRTLPSIPQSPTANRMHRSDLVGGSQAHAPFRFKPSLDTSLPMVPALPPTEEGLVLGEGIELCRGARPRSQSPLSHFRIRATDLQKSLSMDERLGRAEPATPAGRGQELPQQQGEAQKEIYASCRL
ncbi:hypothetical protein SKAU_G00286130 [Synaphobranchus kaupii]|uniref:Uncharacterized protein n=1 Tax=Synaphobranchus kaupii TaxID=118154 RepID=A0A9Q1IMC6_SYNKA|nr:hypothetical protein SKAU_G00286130 [Synaphobranchus kaupii]